MAETAPESPTHAKKRFSMIVSPRSPNKDKPLEGTKELATFLRGDRDRYAAASPTARGYVAPDLLASNLQRGKPFVSSFDGTSQYSIGGPSACGLASMNAVMHVLLSHRKGYRNLELLSMINRQEFHEGVVDICSFLRDTGHLEIEDLLNLPMFQRSMYLATAEYRQCSFESFSMLLNQLSDRSVAVKSPVAAVITKSPEIIATMCITTDENDDLPPHVYIVFDSHARPDSHPNGSAFLFFPDAAGAATYLADLLHVDESLLGQRDLKWQSEMLTAYSAHIFTQPSPDEEEDPRLRTPWSMLYETSVDVVQARGRVKSLEQKLVDLRNENSRMSERLKSIKETLPIVSTTKPFWNNRSYVQPPQQVAFQSREEDAITMTDEQYSKFWKSRGTSAGAARSVPDVTFGVDAADPQLQTEFANAYGSYEESSHVQQDKGKAPEREPATPWAVEAVTPIYEAWVAGRRDGDPFAGDTLSSSNIDSEYFAKISESERRRSSAWTPHTADTESLADRYGHEASRLQVQEAQDEKSRELALRLDREERIRAARKHAFEPPPLFPHENRASSSLSSVSATASALAGFVGNRLSSFARPSAEKKLSIPTYRPSSISGAKPVAQSNSDFMVALRQQMREEEEARSAELARRLQREEETAVLRESSNFVTVPPRSPVKQSSFVGEPKHHGVVSSPQRLQHPRGAVRVEIERLSAPPLVARDEEGRLAILKMELDELNQQKSLELARQLEEEERVNAELIASLSNQKKFECGVCMDEYPLDDVARVDGCEHQFCRDCFKSYIASQLSDGAFPILCPICKAEKAEKPSVVASSLAEQLGLSDKQYEQWSKLDLQRYSLVIDCPHCQQSSLVDRDDYAASPVVTCPLPTCRGQWCKDCNHRVDPTVGPHSCDGQQEMDNYIRQKNLKRCPGCSTPSEKIMGCNHMTCGAPGCNTHFCWIDGQKIITSIIGRDIQAAMQTHYRACKLFDYQ